MRNNGVTMAWSCGRDDWAAESGGIMMLTCWHGLGGTWFRTNEGWTHGGKDPRTYKRWVKLRHTPLDLSNPTTLCHHFFFFFCVPVYCAGMVMSMLHIATMSVEWGGEGWGWKLNWRRCSCHHLLPIMSSSSARVPRLCQTPSPDSRSTYITDNKLNKITRFDNRQFPHSAIYVGTPYPGLFEVCWVEIVLDRCLTSL